MSNKKTTKAADSVDQTVENVKPDAADKPAKEKSSRSRPSTTPPAGARSSTAVAWLALIISVVVASAVIAVNFLGDKDRADDVAQSGAEMRALAASIDATQDAMTALEQNVTRLSELDTEKNSQIESIGRQMNDRLRQLEALPGRLSSVESSMSSIQGISTGARDAWLLAEAEYYMQIANAQLQLANNPVLAGLALTHADDRILQLADPRLTSVRQALSDELRALEVIATPDTTGITLTLASLAGAVDALPLRQEVTVSNTPTTEIDPELSGMDRAIATLKKAVTGVVSVRRADEAMQPLVAPEAQYFLRANLALQLQAARLALLRGEEGIFRESLGDADSWLDEYYDPGSAGVQDARETITEIRDSVFTVAMPDISRSLRLLRQFNALLQATPPTDPEQAQ